MLASVTRTIWSVNCPAPGTSCSPTPTRSGTAVLQGRRSKAAQRRLLHRPQRPRSVRRHRGVPRVRPRPARLRDHRRPHQPIRHLHQLQALNLSPRSRAIVASRRQLETATDCVEQTAFASECEHPAQLRQPALEAASCLRPWQTTCPTRRRRRRSDTCGETRSGSPQTTAGLPRSCVDALPDADTGRATTPRAARGHAAGLAARDRKGSA